MYFTYVVRPGDAPEGKGPQFKPFWDGCMEFNLRGGFLLQLVGFLMIVIGALLGGNVIQIFGCLNGKANDLKNVPIVILFAGSILYTIGALCIQNFRNIADDDASIKQTRGFRAGIKILHQASLLDIFSWVMTTILLYSLMQYFEDEFATKKAGSGSTAIYASAARTLHAVSLLLYGGAFFMLENFHGEGTAEFWGWVLTLLYNFAGLFEILSLTVSNGVLNIVCDILFTVFLAFGLLSSLLWSISFEPIVAKSDVKLTQSAMRNEFYKSRNAMAYYGPPTGIDMGA